MYVFPSTCYIDINFCVVLLLRGLNLHSNNRWSLLKIKSTYHDPQKSMIHKISHKFLKLKNYNMCIVATISGILLLISTL